MRLYAQLLKWGLEELKHPDADANECWEGPDWTAGLMGDCVFHIRCREQETPDLFSFAAGKSAAIPFAAGASWLTWLALRQVAIRSLDYPLATLVSNALVSYCAYLAQTIWLVIGTHVGFLAGRRAGRAGQGR